MNLRRLVWLSATFVIVALIVIGCGRRFRPRRHRRPLRRQRRPHRHHRRLRRQRQLRHRLRRRPLPSRRRKRICSVRRRSSR